MYAPTDSRADAVKNEFQCKLLVLVHSANIVIIATEMYAQVGKLSVSEHYGINAHCINSRERPLQLCAHHLFITN